MKKCHNCGTEVSDDNQFCVFCGAKLDEAPDTASANTEGMAGQGVTQTAYNPIPTDPTGEKKPGKGPIIAIAAGALVLVGIIAAAAVLLLPKKEEDPKQVVIKAFESVFEDHGPGPAEEIFGFTELTEAMRTSNYQTEMAVKFEGISDYYYDTYTGSGLEIVSKNDIENKKSSALFLIKYQGMDLLQAEAYVDEKEFMMALPELTDTLFVLNYADDLQGQIERSPFLGEALSSSGMDMGVFDEYMDYIYSLQDSSDETPFDIAKLWERYKTTSMAIDDLKEAMTALKGEDAICIVDGQEETCRVFEATVPGTAIIEYLRTTSEFFLTDETLRADLLEYLGIMSRLYQGMGLYGNVSSEREFNRMMKEAETNVDKALDELEAIFTDDVRMTVYVDSKGRMAALKAETVLTSELDEEVTVEFNSAFKGGNYLTQNVEFEIRIYDDVDEYAISAYKEESYDGKELLYDLGLSMNGEDLAVNIDYAATYVQESGDCQLDLKVSADSEVVYIYMDGVVTELEKGKVIDVDIDTLGFEMDYDYVELSGRFAAKPLSGEVTIPAGKEMDMLAASEYEWESVVMEIFSKGMELMSKLQ